MSTFEHKNSLRTIEAQIVQTLKNKWGSAKIYWFLLKKSVYKSATKTHPKLAIKTFCKNVANYSYILIEVLF